MRDFRDCLEAATANRLFAPTIKLSKAYWGFRLKLHLRGVTAE